MPKLAIRYPVRSGLVDAIRERRDFDTHGAMWGVTAAPGGTGYLPAEYAASLKGLRHRVTYTVYSYDTPIAWYVQDAGWVVPDVRYSVTTGRHQSAVRMATHDEQHATELFL